MAAPDFADDLGDVLTRPASFPAPSRETSGCHVKKA